MNSLIAAKLNVLETAIVRIEEWTHVLFVVVKGLGARFVSKKVIEEEKKVENLKTTKRTSASGLVAWKVGRKFEEKNAVWETIAAKNIDIYYDDCTEDEIAVWQVEAKFVRAIPN